MRILTKVIMIVLAGAFLMLAAAGYFVFSESKSALQLAIKERQEELGRQVMDKIDRGVFAYYRDIEQISLALGGEVDQAAMQERVHELLLLTGPWTALSLEQPQASDGAALAAWKQAMRGDIYYSDVIVSSANGMPTMIFAAPIRDQAQPSRPIVGAVIGHMDWSAIRSFITSFDSSTEFSLYSKAGALVATNQSPAAPVFDALVTRSRSKGYLAYKGNQWELAIKSPTQIVFAPAEYTASKIVIILTPIIMLCMFLIVLLMRQFVVNPVVQYTNVLDDKVRQSYASLKMEKEKIAALLESIGDGVMAVDVSGKVTLWNGAATVLTGRSAKEVLGKPYKTVLRLVREDTRKDSSGFIAEAMKQQTKKFMESHTMLIKKNGMELAVADSAAPIFDANGDVQGAIVVFRDVTKERELERIKTDFLAIASHEMRTPLTLIKGFAERLQRVVDKSHDTKSAVMVSSIYRNSDRLYKIVNDFLDVVSLEEKQVLFENAPLDLAELVAETVDELQAPAKAKKLSLAMVPVQEPLPLALADRSRTKQILMNLLSNAIHYTEKGTIRVALSKRRGFLKVSVIDTGIGIPKESRKALFKKFSTIQKTFLRTKEYGSGLGLYISKLVVESMGGEVWLEKSIPGAGSTFSFVLPIHTKRVKH